MIAIIDYGVGNLFSLQSSLAFLGQQAVVTGDAEQIKAAERIILPGVGAFGDAAAKLRQNGLDELICEQAAQGKLLLGICLGMQLLLEKGYEYGEHRGLGLIPGSIVPLSGAIPAQYKIPHIGWNSLSFPKDKPTHPLFRYSKPGDCVYFVHSFYAAECEESVIASTEYGAEITAAVARENVCGMQFHPEKSGTVGLAMLRAFCEMQA